MGIRDSGTCATSTDQGMRQAKNGNFTREERVNGASTHLFSFPCQLNMLHSLCASPAVTLPGNAAAAGAAASQFSNLSTKPSTICPTSLGITSSSSTSSHQHQHQHQQSEFPLPLPELPAHVKEKIVSLEILGIDSGRALALNPDLHAASLDSVRAVISYLLSRGIHHKDLPRILGMCPKILTSSIHGDLRPVFAFLSKDLKVPDANFRKVIKKCPRLLSSSVRDQLKPALIYLQSLGFSNTNALAYQDPILLVSSVENTLVPKLRHLTGLGLTREEAVGMVLRCPGLFTFSIENNFKPKYEYYMEEMGGNLEELREFPQYFAFSLEKRIKPRHQELKNRRITMPLSVMLKSTDEEFMELMEKKNS